MADISIEFHATEIEIGEWLKEWSGFERFTLVAMTFRPFVVTKVQVQEIPQLLSSHAVRRLCLCASTPRLDVKSKSEFEQSNKDVLILDVGYLSEEGLGESWLACRCESLDALAKWRGIVKDLKAKTYSGVTAINRRNGISAFYKGHRYSQGAKQLEDNGTPILPAQGSKGPVIRLGTYG